MEMGFIGLVIVSLVVGNRYDALDGWLVFGIGCIIIGLFEFCINDKS